MFPIECSDIYNKISEITQSLMHENRWSGNEMEFTTWWNEKVLFLKWQIIGPNCVFQLADAIKEKKKMCSQLIHTAKYMLVMPYMMMKMFASVSFLKQKYSPAARTGKDMTQLSATKLPSEMVPLPPCQCSALLNSFQGQSAKDATQSWKVLTKRPPCLEKWVKSQCAYARSLTWEHEDKQLQVKVEGTPGCWLMLRHRRNDGDVVFGIGWVQQGVEAPSPGGNFCRAG